MLYGIKDASNLTVISNATKKQVLYANYCNTTDLSFKADSVYAMLKGVKAIRWDKAKEGTFKTEMEVFDLKWIALLLGTTFNPGVVQISKREVLPVTGGTATLVGTPKTGSLTIFKLDSDGLTHLTEQTVGTPATTADRYSISGQTLTFNTTTSFPDNNGKIVCYYLADSDATAQTLTVKVADYPGSFSVVGDTMVRGQDGVDEYVQFTLPNCKPQLNIDLSFSTDNPTKLSVTWDVFPDVNGDMLKFTII